MFIKSIKKILNYLFFSKIFVEFQPNFVKIALKGNNSMILEGELYDKIKVEDSIWSIEDEERLVLTLEKAGENIWKTVIKGDQEIDATKVDNSKKLEEFDYETQVIFRFFIGFFVDFSFDFSCFFHLIFF